MNKKTKASDKLEFKEQLLDAIDGLVYISEIDSDVYSVFESNLSGNVIKNLYKTLKIKRGANKQYLEFKDKLTRDCDWHLEFHKKNAAGFRRLFELLEEKLSNLTVVRTVGPEVEIYIIGVGEQGDIAGVRMLALET